MPQSKAALDSEPGADPFLERHRFRLQQRVRVLGGDFWVRSDSAPLMRIVQHALCGLPRHYFARPAPRFELKLISAKPVRRSGREPALIRPIGGGAVLYGAMDSASFAAVSAASGEALIHVAADMLRFPYHVRYELIEFAAYTLAARAQQLVALHAACIGAGGQGALLLGASGSGKSTLALLCVLQGMDFLAEDSVLVEPKAMRATGLGNFLHIRTDSMRMFSGRAASTRLRRSPVITRRSGIKKFEIDMRASNFRLAPHPLKLSVILVVSPKRAAGAAMLRPLRPRAIAKQLAASQPYAAAQPGWSAFLRQAASLPVFELLRGQDPQDSVNAVRTLLTQRVARSRAHGAA